MINLNKNIAKIESFNVISGYIIKDKNCRKNGKICTFSGRIRKNDGFSSEFTEIASISDQACFPTLPTSVPCSIVTTDSGRCLGSGEVQLNTDGKIKVRASDSTVGINYSEVCISCTWIIA